MKDLETVFKELNSLKGKSVGEYLITKVYRRGNIISVDAQLGDTANFIFYYISIDKDIYKTEVYKDFRFLYYYSVDTEGIIEGIRLAEQYKVDKPIRYKKYPSKKEYYDISDGYLRFK